MKFEKAFEVLVDLYGMPNWQKEGQSMEKIKGIWEEELKGYSDEQIKEACYRLFRYRKTMTFPTISQLMSMLYEEEKPLDVQEYNQEKVYCPDLELYKKVNPKCSFGSFGTAFRKMVEDFKFYNPEMKNLTFADGLANAMQINNWWENKIGEYLQ